MTLLTTVFVTLFGLAFGSFLNVCISRLPQHKSIVTPRSRCAHCATFIRASDNVPLLSWILLRGRCRTCRAAISPRYPLVEAALPALWIATYFAFGWTTAFAGTAVLCFLLLGLAVMDAETMRLPDAFTLPGMVLGVVFAFVYPQGWASAISPSSSWRAVGASVASAVLAGGLILFIRWFYQTIRGREGMGLGDAKLMAMIAAWMGIQRALLVFFLAVVTAALVGISGLMVRHSPHSRKAWLEDRLPLGAFLACAALYAIFLGRSTIRWYTNFF